MQKTWRLYEYLLGTDWIYMGGILLSFSSRLQKYGIKNHITEVLSRSSHLNNHFYFYDTEYKNTQREILKKITKNPDWGLNFNQKLKNLNNEYFRIAQKVEKMDLARLSNKVLLDIWQKICKAKENGHAAGVITTWILDADEQPFTRWMTAQLAGLIKKSKSKEDSAEVFAILSSPTEITSVQAEEIEFLKLFQEVKKKGLEASRPKIARFAKKHGWIYYKYIGPVKSVGEYETDIKDELKQGFDPKTKLSEIKKKKEELKKKQADLIKILKPDDNFKKLVRFTQTVILMKDHRKASQFYGAYVNEKILKEVAKRLSLSLTQVRHFLPWEIEPALLKNVYNPKELDQRYEFSVYRTKGSDYKILTGQKARDYLEKQKFEKVKTDVGEAKGTCACPGKAKGTTKIINTPKEISKIKPGEIMISHTTYPALVPAMKKASAIVTDEGGITSHAAIVSRELDTPCIVGTKNASQVFKDGDKVEIDATKGAVRRIK